MKMASTFGDTEADREEKEGAQRDHDRECRLADDLTTIVSEAEKHGTLPRLKSVAIYFDEAELRAIIKSLRSHSPAGSSPELEAILKDPAAVHLNMLRGGIAMPSLENIKHLYPEVRDAFAAVEELKTALKPFVDAFDMGDRLSYQDFERAKAALPSTSKTCGGDRHG